MTSDKPHNGAWIFVSHSHQDLVKVRKVRNELEKLGHNPLLFYLKCMEETNEQLPDLIQKEIYARNWFVLCESENSKRSDWVRKEVEIIKSMPDKVYKSVNLEKTLGPQIKKLQDLSKRATIFVSYQRYDEAFASSIVERLRREDYRVFFDRDIPANIEWTKWTTSSIDQAIQQGFVLLLLSSASLNNAFVYEEIQYALEKATSSKSNVIPIIVNNKETVYSRSGLIPTLEKIHMVDFTTGDLQENLTNLIAYLKTKEME